MMPDEMKSAKEGEAREEGYPRVWGGGTKSEKTSGNVDDRRLRGREEGGDML